MGQIYDNKLPTQLGFKYTERVVADDRTEVQSLADLTTLIVPPHFVTFVRDVLDENGLPTPFQWNGLDQTNLANWINPLANLKQRTTDLENETAALTSGIQYAIPQTGNTPTTEPAPTQNGIYRVKTINATYTNFGGIVVPNDAGFIYDIQVSGLPSTPVYTLLSTDVNITIDATPTPNSPSAAQSGGVFDALALKANQTDLEDVQEDLLNITGGETTTPVSLSFSNGAILSADGSEFTTTAQKRTPLLPLNGADVLTYYGMRSFEGATYSLLALYDASNAFVASVVNGRTDGAIQSGSLNVKTLYPTATQFRLACNSNPAFIALITASTTNIIVGSIPTIEENVETNTVNIAENTVLIDKFKKQLFKKRLPIESLITPTESNVKTLANLYESTLTGTPRTVNTIFRTSVNVAVGTSTFPSDRYFNINRPRKLGYTIEFLLNGRYLEVAGRETSYSFNLEVDGVVICKNYIPSIGTYDSNGKTWIKFDLGSVKTNAHVKLFWFNGFGGVATEGTISTYTEDRLKLIVDGDSIVEGARSGSGGNISDVAGSVFSAYVGIIARTFNLDLYNAGVGGSGFVSLGNSGQPNMVDRFDTYISPFDCDIFLFSGGLNDGYITYGAEDEAAVIAYYEKLGTRFSNTKTRVICVSPFDPLTSTPKTNNLGVRGIRDLQKTLSVQYGFPFIDIIDGITYDELGNVLMDSSTTIGGIFDNGRKNSTNFDVSDQTHPNAIGYLYFGKRVFNEVMRILNNTIIQ